ncbi:MAG: hypothetical protein K8S87_01605 [Planctomycetes bacterium]|nr:hypothetical protein [Planctomycetota bacterium]
MNEKIEDEIALTNNIKERSGKTLLSLQEASNLLGISIQTLRRGIIRRQISTIQTSPNGEYWITPRSLAKFLIRKIPR